MSAQSNDPPIEEMVPLGKASPLWPKRRFNRRPSYATIFRWSREGLRGVRLKTKRVGGTLCVHRLWVQQFVDDVTKAWPAEAGRARRPDDKPQK